MKKLFLLWVFLSTASIYASAQICPITSSSTVPKDAATWNWEEPISNPGSAAVRPEYCNTWNAFIAPGASAPFKVSMGAPWDSPAGPTLLAVNLGFDYKKSDGWELLKMDFGGGTRAIAAPYFVLYQKTTGTLRIYSYVNTPGLLTGLVFTLKHSSTNTTYSGKSTANLSLGRYPVVAPDKYLSQPSSDPVSNKEVLTYVSFYSGGQKWAMGQFNMLLDPNFNNSVYNLNALEFQIFGLVKSEVQLSGSFEFKTDYAMSGSADKVTPPSDPTKILADGQKFLGNITSVIDKIKSVNASAEAFKKDIGNNPTDVAKGLKDVADRVGDATNSGAYLKTISDLAGTLGGFFGLSGSLIGLLTGDSGGAGKSAFVPTVSKGTIQLTGSITVQSPLVTFAMLTPGTNHYAAGSSNTATPPQYYTQTPYYNCPLGIFNLQNTPVLKKVDYQRYTRAHSYDPDFATLQIKGSDPYISCTSYQLDSRIIPVVNAASGLAIRSVKYAICKVVPLADVATPYYHRYDDGLPFTYVRDYKFIYSQVANGALEVYPYEPKSANAAASVIVQTPFTDASCPPANGLPFNAPTQTADSPVFLRVIAELVPAGPLLNPPPLYFSQDYAVDLINDPNSSSYQGQIYPPGRVPPYNLRTSAAPLYAPTVDPYASDPTAPTVTKSGQLTYGGSYLGSSSSPIGQVANSTLIFDGNSSVTVNPRTSGNITYPVVFRAQNDVQIQGTLNVTAGNEFVVSTELSTVSSGALRAKTPCYQGYAQFVNLNPSCGYDANATSRVLATTASSQPTTSQLIAFPNPASSSTTAQLSVSDEECIERIELINIAGQVSWQQLYSCTHKLVANVPTAGLAKGIYVLKVVTDKQIYSTKLSIE